MVDTISPELRHYVMSQVHSSDTKPELRLRHALWWRGFRYRINDKRLPGKPDIVLPRYNTVIFVHGCFWHGHKDCDQYRVPKSNQDFWIAKVQRNKERDQEVWRRLEAKGWCVIIVWECQLKKGKIDETVERVAAEIVQNGEAYHAAQEERKRAQDAYRKDRNARKERERALMGEVKTL